VVNQIVDSVPLHYFTAVASPFAHATTASNANPDRHNGFTAGSNERVWWKIERGRLRVFTGNALRARLLRRPLIAFVPLFVPCAKLSGRFSRELFENAIELR